MVRIWFRIFQSRNRNRKKSLCFHNFWIKLAWYGFIQPISWCLCFCWQVHLGVFDNSSSGWRQEWQSWVCCKDLCWVISSPTCMLVFILLCWALLPVFLVVCRVRCFGNTTFGSSSRTELKIQIRRLFYNKVFPYLRTSIPEVNF